MAFNQPEHIIEVAIDVGVRKANASFSQTIILGFLAGAYISFGFLLYIRVTAGLPVDVWGTSSEWVGAALFPLGLILVIMAGGELVTGNMMAITTAWLSGEISSWHVFKNWTLIVIMNFIGAIFVAFWFGHILGLTETGDYLLKTVSIAGNKLEEPFHMAFISGVGANWLVCLAVWLAYAAKDGVGKILGIWFPIMAFVAIGFQHVVANMFIIPAAIFAGYYHWAIYFENFGAVFLGNLLGGALFVGGFYWVAYAKKTK